MEDPVLQDFQERLLEGILRILFRFGVPMMLGWLPTKMGFDLIGLQNGDSHKATIAMLLMIGLIGNLASLLGTPSMSMASQRIWWGGLLVFLFTALYIVDAETRRIGGLDWGTLVATLLLGGVWGIAAAFFVPPIARKAGV